MHGTRNPVAGNAWKFNKHKVVPDKRAAEQKRRLERQKKELD
jgi:hypothetical protein